MLYKTGEYMLIAMCCVIISLALLWTGRQSAPKTTVSIDMGQREYQEVEYIEVGQRQYEDGSWDTVVNMRWPQGYEVCLEHYKGGFVEVGCQWHGGIK